MLNGTKVVWVTPQLVDDLQSLASGDFRIPPPGEVLMLQGVVIEVRGNAVLCRFPEGNEEEQRGIWVPVGELQMLEGRL